MTSQVRQVLARVLRTVPLRTLKNTEALEGISRVKELAQRVLNELELDYAVTLVSGGESGNYEIAMWDRPHDTYFSLKLKWPRGTPADALAGDIRNQLEQRLASSNRPTDRRPNRRWPAA